MLARVFACALVGLKGVVVDVEVDTASNLPKMVIVGLPDAAMQESRERVQSAVKNSGLIFPRKKVTSTWPPLYKPTSKRSRDRNMSNAPLKWPQPEDITSS